MPSLKNKLDSLDASIISWMGKNGPLLVRMSLGIIYIWFGALKPIGMSPAHDLVAKTVTWLPPEFFIPFLGWWEVTIGICFLVKPLTRLAILLLFLQMPGTFMPLILLPEICFTSVPFGLTLAGQYIIKNLLIISGTMVVGGTLRK